MEQVKRFDLHGKQMVETATGMYVLWSEAADEVSFAKQRTERLKIKDENDPVVYGVHNGGAYFDWGWKGCGFGQLSFDYDHETGKWSTMNECMGPESVRKLLHAYADYVADQLKPVIEAEEAEWEARRADREASA